MRFVLVLNLKDADYYGRIPELLSDSSERQTETFRLEDDDWSLLNNNFIDPVNQLCGTLLDDGDVDYFNSTQCEELRSWLLEQLVRECNPRLQKLYRVLLDYSSRAIALGTGVIVEL